MMHHILCVSRWLLQSVFTGLFSEVWNETYLPNLLQQNFKFLFLSRYRYSDVSIIRHVSIKRTVLEILQMTIKRIVRSHAKKIVLFYFRNIYCIKLTVLKIFLMTLSIVQYDLQMKIIIKYQTLFYNRVLRVGRNSMIQR